MSSKPEMVFHEAFRIIDNIAEAVAKLKEASVVIQKDGSDLKAWEAEGRVVKDKIRKETTELVNVRELARRNGAEQLLAVKKLIQEARDFGAPALRDKLELEEALRGLKAEIVKATAEKEKIYQDSQLMKTLFKAESAQAKVALDVEINNKLNNGAVRLEKIQEAIVKAKKDMNDL